MADVVAAAHCPRCFRAYTGRGSSSDEAHASALAAVREHLVKAQTAEMDDGLHDYALELWDETSEG